MDPLLDNAPCGFLCIDDTGQIQHVNHTLLEWTGYQRLVGTSIEGVLTVGSRIFYQTHVFPMLRMQGRADEIYLSLQHREGREIPVLLSAKRAEREGRPAIDWVMLPMRERQRYEDELLQARRAAEEASQAKAQFLSIVSHELRTPLQAILGYADILAMGLHGPVTDQQRNDLGHIKSATQHLVRLINDILEFTRLESGRMGVRIETVVLDTVLEQVESLLAPRFQETGLHYARECAAGLRLKADPGRLQQILLNLLTNATKFTPRGGEIRVRGRQDDGRVLLEVADTGTGIPADQLDRIFVPFVQVDRNRVEAARRGAGLGLAISRQLARAMDGELSVESEVGRGSTFRLTLPAD